MKLPAIVEVTSLKQCHDPLTFTPSSLSLSLSRVRKQGNLIIENCKYHEMSFEREKPLLPPEGQLNKKNTLRGFLVAL